MRAVSESSRSFVTAFVRARNFSKSPSIIRPRMSTVAPGSVAPRTPASVTRLRAAVCESDRDVGAR